MTWVKWIAFASAGILFLAPADFVRLQEVPAPPGRIAYIGADFNVYSTAVGSPATQITVDAGLSANRRDVTLYQLPTWANDGRLAYFGATVSRNGDNTLGVYVSADGIAPGARLHQFDGDTFTFAMWAPAPCAQDENCLALALLLSRSSSRGFVVEIVEDVGGAGDAEATHQVVGTGSPFYFSWSADASQMLWHRNNERLDVYDVASDATVRLASAPGFFSAPAWAPGGDRIAAVIQDRQAGRSALAVGLAEQRELEPLLGGLTGPVSFTWSPNGAFLAYTDRQRVLTILDSMTGEVIVQSDSDEVLAFFWAPDSSKIAFLTHRLLLEGFDAKAEPNARLASLAQDVGFAWSVLDVTTGEVTNGAAFQATQGFIYILSFFDQFAQSHSIWSPDSRYLVYAEALGDEREIVQVLDTQDLGAAPMLIAEGSLGIWSEN